MIDIVENYTCAICNKIVCYQGFKGYQCDRCNRDNICMTCLVSSGAIINGVISAARGNLCLDCVALFEVLFIYHTPRSKLPLLINKNFISKEGKGFLRAKLAKDLTCVERSEFLRTVKDQRYFV